jgi:catalase-peroxidase
MRGGANGARIRLEPQKNWTVNDPKELSKTLSILKNIHKDFNKSLPNKKRISFADLVILSGATAIEESAKNAGVNIKVPFKLGRSDASQEQTGVNSFDALEPKADGFRNYYGDDNYLSPVNSMIDRSNMLSLTVPEMTALVGGMRVLSANHNNLKHGVFTDKAGVLSNDFFVNLLDMSTKWTKSENYEGIYNGLDRKTGKLKWTATSIDLMFGSSAELRAIAEVYAADNGKSKFIHDFVKAWSKVMTLDRFDLNK